MENKDKERNEVKNERMILSHEPVPGYRTIFHVVLTCAVIYLGIIFLFV